MPRPKKSEQPALEKIEKCFWELMETEDYPNISITKLAVKSGINRNTLYYYFEDLDDLARFIFQKTVNQETVQHFLMSFPTIPSEKPLDPWIFDHAKKIHFLARSKSSFARQLVEDQLVQSWFRTFNIDQTALDPSDLNILHFIASGITSMLAREELITHPENFQPFPQSILGKAVLETMESFQRKSQRRLKLPVEFKADK